MVNSAPRRSNICSPRGRPFWSIRRQLAKGAILIMLRLSTNSSCKARQLIGSLRVFRLEHTAFYNQMAQMIVLFQIVQACSPTWCAKRKDRSRRKKPDFCATGPNLEKWKKKAVHHHHLVAALRHNSFWLAVAENRQPPTSAADHLLFLITWMNEEEAQPAADGVHHQLSIRPPTTTPTTSVVEENSIQSTEEMDNMHARRQLITVARLRLNDALVDWQRAVRTRVCHHERLTRPRAESLNLDQGRHAGQACLGTLGEDAGWLVNAVGRFHGRFTTVIGQHKQAR
ncbi:hypothetical protein T4D_5382 [Trichinella pseudospiralis]|uniref:Uncharacterized protein n=1 Tax=Trichinella pseudospiralis TaxID=6337 RepID=A0A0V1FQ93_TRIPS|nr:hypothetical protein T4D_5382 [Trichinella pseudospiralis]